jgi:hypothetical protein
MTIPLVAAGRPTHGLRLFANQQGGQVDGGDFNVTHDDPRHDHRAIQDHHLRAIGQRDDQVAAVHLDVVDVGSGRQHDGAVRTRRHGAHRSGLDGMAFYPRGECGKFRLRRLLAVSGSIDIPFALEIHLSIPTCRHGTDRRSAQKTISERSLASELYLHRHTALADQLLPPVCNLPPVGPPVLTAPD